MSTRTKVLIFGGLAVLVAVVLVASAKSREKNLVRVTTEKAAKSDLVATVSANGRVRAMKKVDISSQVMGQIVNLAVREGDVVKKGDFLLQIDKAQYDANTRAQEGALAALFAQRDSDRASREQAQREYDREKKNFEANISSEQVMQKARLALDAAKANEQATERRIEQSRAQLAANRDSLSKTTLVAPIAGVVTARPVEAGENAIIGTMNNPGTVLLTVSDMSIVEAEMEVDETDIPHVKLGQKAEMTIDAYPEQKFKGAVSEIGGSPITKSALGADATAVNFKVKVRFEQPPAGIRPGFSVSGQIETDRRPGALAISIPALVVADEASLRRPEKGKKKTDAKAAEKGAEKGAEKAGSGAALAAAPTPGTTLAEKQKKEVEGVFVVKKDGTVDFRKIKTGINAELKVEVAEGLTEGEEVVTGPFRVLRSLKIGDKVKVDNQGPKDGPPRG